MIHSLSYSKATFSVLLLVVASWSAHQSALAQTEGKKAGNDVPKLVGLQEMLAIALKHNPDIRVADAKLHSAEADLDRTRLEVVRKIIAFREKWQAQRFSVQATELEMANVERMQKLVKDGVVARRNVVSLVAAKESIVFQRIRLAEIEAELPFLLGQAPGEAAPEANDKIRKLIRDVLLPQSRQILELRTNAYRFGHASILEMVPAHRQVAEYEVRLATTSKKRIAAVEAQKRLLQTVREMIEAAHQAGQVTQADVLTIDLELSKLDLWILELNGD